MIEVSRFLSYVLRHKPEAIGLTLDGDGWASIDALVAASNRAGRELDPALIRGVVESSEKKRFEISHDGSRIRARHGHSVTTVSISYEQKVPPEILYHGTAKHRLETILSTGLNPAKRRYVHLSTDAGTALEVGQRHGVPVVLRVVALDMHQHGFKFYCADNGVWLVDRVPSQFLRQEAR
jgi:putative RNA 2'-phosphotransferase